MRAVWPFLPVLDAVQHQQQAGPDAGAVALDLRGAQPVHWVRDRAAFVVHQDRPMAPDHPAGTTIAGMVLLSAAGGGRREEIGVVVCCKA